jgi:DNA polymerase-4
MDAFYASVEQRDRPELRGKPVLVGVAERRGVVSAASYEARRFGCRSAQPMAVALRLCPHARVVAPRHSHYAAVSARVFEILGSVTPDVEPLSIDEAFLDVTGTERLFGPPRAVAERVRARIRADLSLTASVGVAPNKFLAKLASDLRKPDAVFEFTPENLDEVLRPLPIERLWGVGEVTAKRMRDAGIRTFDDVRARRPDELARLLGSLGDHVRRLAFGEDSRPVVRDAEAKSIGQEQTFSEDVADAHEVRAVLLSQCEEVARRLRRSGLLARGATVKVRYGAFETITRTTTFGAPTSTTNEIHAAAREAFDRWARTSFRPVRLIGVAVHRFEPPSGQGELFPDAERERQARLDAAVDGLVSRFGRDAVRRAGDAT